MSERATASVSAEFMQLWTFNGVGTHLAMFVVFHRASPLFPFAPLVARAIVAGPMNLFTLYLKVRESQLENALRAEILLDHPAVRAAFGTAEERFRPRPAGRAGDVVEARSRRPATPHQGSVEVDGDLVVGRARVPLAAHDQSSL